jgi:hypothetical protein
MAKKIRSNAPAAAQGVRPAGGADARKFKSFAGCGGTGAGAQIDKPKKGGVTK